MLFNCLKYVNTTKLNNLRQINPSSYEICSFINKRYSSSKPNAFITKTVDPETGEVKKRKTTIIPKITLLSGNDVTVTTLVEAEKLAKRRDLKLVKIIDLDTKTQRTVYKLMTGSEYHAEDLKQRELKKKEKQNSFIKGEKVLMLNANISEHDLQTNCRKIEKWIDKLYEIKVVISGATGSDKAENVYNSIELSMKDKARLLQKRQKGTDIKFQILPNRNLSTDTKSNKSLEKENGQKL